VWMSDVRTQRKPSRAGFEGWSLKGPHACADLLRAYVEDYVIRFRPVATDEEPRVERLRPHPDPPHQAFFATGGPFLSVRHRDTQEALSQSPLQSGKGGRHLQFTRQPSTHVGPELPTPKTASTPAAVETVGSKRALPTGPPHTAPPPTSGACMWHCAGIMGLKNKQEALYTCLGTTCAKNHTATSTTEVAAMVTKADMRSWMAGNPVKEKLAGLIPNFNMAWL